MAFDPMSMAAIMSAIGAAGSYFGKPKQAQNIQLPTRSEGQIGDMNQMRQTAMQGLQDPTAGFQPIEDNARNQFMSNTLPKIAAQFGGLGGIRNSGFQSMMSGAGQGFENQLASDKAQYGMQNRNSLMNLMQMGMQPQFENIYRPESQGAMQSMGSSLAGGGLAALLQMISGKYLGDQKQKNTSKSIEEWRLARQNPGGA